MWVIGPLGVRVPRPVVVVPNIAVVQFLLVPVMVAKNAQQLMKMNIATLVIAQLIAT
jgi:hypothetical protein